MTFRRLTAAFIVAISASWVLAGAAGAAFPGQNGSIAFERYSGGIPAQVVTTGPTGTGAAVLIDNGVSPAWSADGAQVAFVRPDPRTSRPTIHVANADGTGVRLVGPQIDDPPGGSDFGYFTHADNPAWSPDGTRIAYDRNVVACGGHTCVENPEGIWTINVDGTGARQVATYGNRPAWSPDGSKIAYDTGSMYSPGDIVVINADGSGEVSLTSSGADDRGPNWSPDGAKIAFSRGTEFYAPRTIEVVGSDGAPLGALVQGSSNESPAWSPDGTKVVFESSRDGGGLYTVNADGTAVTRLPESGNNDLDPDWQPLVGPRRESFKNASQFCRAERAFLGDPAFAARYGGGASAHGKCVSHNN